MKVTDKVDIKAFSIVVGKTQQNVYQQLKTRLAPYTANENGKKMISLQAAVDIFGISVEQLEQMDLSNNLESNSSDFVKPLKPESSEMNLLQQTIELLQAQLQTKDQQIEQLQKELEAERSHGREVTDKLAILTSQAQSLQAKQLQLFDTMDDQSVAEQEPEQPPKRSIWRRLFKK